MKQVEDKINYTMEVYNPVLKVWSSADSPVYTGAARMPACCCHDITCCKKAKKICKSIKQVSRMWNLNILTVETFVKKEFLL